MEHTPDDKLACTQVDVDRAAAAALRRYVHGAIIAFIGLVIAFAVGLAIQQHDAGVAREEIEKQGQVAAANLVRSGNIIAVEGCNRDFVNIQRIRALLWRAEKNVVAQYEAGSIGPVEYQRAKDFYAGERDSIKLPDCRESANVLTTKNAAKMPPPKPYYPGMAGSG